MTRPSGPHYTFQPPSTCEPHYTCAPRYLGAADARVSARSEPELLNDGVHSVLSLLRGGARGQTQASGEEEGLADREEGEEGVVLKGSAVQCGAVQGTHCGQENTSDGASLWMHTTRRSEKGNERSLYARYVHVQVI